MATTLRQRDYLLRLLQNDVPGTTDPVLDYIGREAGANDRDYLGRLVDAPAWEATTAYAHPRWVSLSTGEVLKTTVGGTSDLAEPALPGYGNTVVDGTVTWEQVTG